MAYTDLLNSSTETYGWNFRCQCCLWQSEPNPCGPTSEYQALLTLLVSKGCFDPTAEQGKADVASTSERDPTRGPHLARPQPRRSWERQSVSYGSRSVFPNVLIPTQLRRGGSL
jgi:hypothetical protein